MSKPFPFSMWPHDAGLEKAEVNLMYEKDSGRTYTGNGNRMNRRSRAGSMNTLLPGDSAPKVAPSASSQPAPETSSPSNMRGSSTAPAISKPISGGAASMANAAYARMMQRKQAAASSPSSAGPTSAPNLAGPTSAPNLAGPTSSPGSGSPSQTQEQRMRRYANLSADIGPNFTAPEGDYRSDLSALAHRHPRIFTADSPGLESWGEHYDRTGESREPTEQEYILNRQRGQDLLRDEENASIARLHRRPEPGRGPTTIPTVGQLAQYSREYKGRSGKPGR
jgi:hypothetical protein